MKTFEEALNIVAPGRRTSELTPDVRRQLEAQANAVMARYDTLYREAKANRVLGEVLRAVCYSSPDPEAAALELFMFGLKIGMEMEKSDERVALP